MTSKAPVGGAGLQPVSAAQPPLSSPTGGGGSRASARQAGGGASPSTAPTSVLLLSGGPDREHEVSIMSARGVADALRTAGLDVHTHEIARTSPTNFAAELGSLPGDVVFPVLHGSFGEGGPLQDLLEASGRAYVGCRPAAARLAMDKIATKLAAARALVPTAPAAVLNPADDRCPVPFETAVGRGVVLKPIHDGSSVGVHLVLRPEQWGPALAIVRQEIREHPGRAYMVESLVAPRLPHRAPGLGESASAGAAHAAGARAASSDLRSPHTLRTRELTVGILTLPGAPGGHPSSYRALPVIEIRPATEFYDYDAKYIRDDTQYVIVPPHDPVVPAVQEMGVRVAAAIGVRHICRVDFLDPASAATGIPPQMLEVNTMPGFTSHSLLPMAARGAGIPMPSLCRMLVEAAWAEQAALR